MIVPMFKYSFLVHHSDYSLFLDRLKDLGVLHVIESEEELTVDILDKYREISELEKMLKFLKGVSVDEDINEGVVPQDGQVLVETIKASQSEIEHLNQQKSVLEKERSQLLPWGDFSWEGIKKIHDEAGVQMFFFYVSNKKFKAEWSEQYPIELIATEKGFTYFVVLQQDGGDVPDLEAEEVRLPNRSLSEVSLELEKVKKQLIAEDRKIKSLANGGVQVLEGFRLKIMDALATNEAKHHTSDQLDGQVKLMEGWVPDDKQEALDQYLDGESVYYSKNEAKTEDKPPVKLKNNKFNKLFETISNLYSLPAYNEIDLTPYLAPFYLLFFGFCFSDAGYGLLFVLVASLVKIKQKETSSVLTLIQLLGASTMFFGLLGGTFFGIELYKTNLPVYRDVAKLMEASGITVQDVMFKASLGLGLVQILFGMFLRAAKAIKQSGVLHAVSTLGWAFLIIASAINYYLEEKGLVEFGNILYLIIAGLCGIAIFFMNTPGKSLLLNFGAGLWDAYNTVVGGVGDLLSYVRLFALGLASAILGLVFNDLALKLINPEASIGMQVLGFVMMLLILLVGHAINIFMSGLGSMVHPLRLTFVEFYKNAGFEGGGKAYNPFRRQSN